MPLTASSLTTNDDRRRRHEPYRSGPAHRGHLGGARGIGLAVAERALQSGADVALWDVDGERLSRTAAELKTAYKERTVSDSVVELTDEASVDAAVQKAIAAHGKIDVLVNNAGITGGNGTTWELAPDVWRPRDRRQPDWGVSHLPRYRAAYAQRRATAASSMSRPSRARKAIRTRRTTARRRRG